ncbi:MAG TPA: hypothetical protein PLM71_02730 [Syntrophorhabdaceae bacterium]|nr:hypothetical protein [Syntrophorhabdaceae bacterium]HPU29221.1 hypothetical protein [Syntrophorhabdaceae bacterium]
MKLSKPVLFTLIGAIIVIIYLFFFAGPKKIPPVKIKSPETEGTKVQTGLMEKDRPKDGPKKVANVDAFWKNDPFMLPQISQITTIDEEMAHEPLKLHGIIEGKDGRYAIIGTNIVKKDDFIGDERVLDIGKDTVIIARKGKKKTVFMSDLSKEMDFKTSSPGEKR